ncbi:alkyl sulfatase dimerization domain-containing protein [Cupriavidus basilensis]|uniref:Alkyl sulfatase dimerization domain-containing protein n=1 Tax=Cupriavidus basilensis TaxID=68895 RepID=A0ABT6AK13_9BURK|nr:alkyl sulfatase dimerization domain-containing protein [Cupriavidus basilensis]MDF3832121.1 alkyl sulfatase dimerization domain-containing protein [Cupriavidus basilensis]
MLLRRTALPALLTLLMLTALQSALAQVPGAPASPATAQANAAWLQTLPFGDRQDFEDARRGLVARFPEGAIHGADGRVAWDFNAYAFERETGAPPTVNPSLWRLAQLNNEAGLFKVTDRIYQVRGADLSNMNIIEGDTGIIVMDPLIVAETAHAALALYYAHRPRKPVVAVIYTHSHVDHFGGAKGIVSEADVKAGKIAVIAPAGFMEEAISENVLAGNAMSRRAQYMYGAGLPRSATGQVDAGLGKGTSRGTVTLLAPTDLIGKTIDTRRIDGIDIEFQLTPGTEAPAEMNLYFPQMRTLCIAENAARTQHNILTIRGAQVRDAKAWSYYIGQALARYGERSDILIAQHHWPTWGQARINEFLSDQRDMYAYLNDQTLRLMNHGLTPMDIADTLRKLPEPLASKWYARDYYGSISHNVRAVYQRYLGFYDGNPAHLDPLPPVQTATKTIEWMGGPDAVLAKAREAYARGEYRWVAQIGNELVFADPSNAAARALQADALEQLGYQSENATWRNAYLSGAQELRNGVRKGTPGGTSSPDLVRALTVPHFFDYLAVRLNADKAAGKTMTLNWNFTDLRQRYAMTLRNSALTYLADAQHPQATASITLDKATLDRISLKQLTLPDAVRNGSIRIAGDPQAVASLFGMLDTFDGHFNIVTPQAAP